MGMEVFLQEEQKMAGAHKIGAAISSARIAGGNITDVSFFLKKLGENQKGTAGRVKRHDNLRHKRHDKLRHFTTICTILWRFSFLGSIDIKCHKTL